jgi:hypothetical protein
LRELLRLRWGPGRAGKTRALYLDVIARAEHGEATLSEIAARTGRRRYDVRRALVMAEARALVECSGETYRLVPEFAAALDEELEASGIKRAERLQRDRYEREREAYRSRLIRRRNRIPEVWPSTGRAGELEPDGFTEDLERVEAEPVEVFAPEVTDHTDPEQFRELAALIRSEVEGRRAANPLSASELARRHLDRLRKEHPDSYARYRLEPRKLSWEIAGLGWTRTVYSHDTISRALSELEPVEVAA